MSVERNFDKVYLNCRREAVLIFMIWLTVSSLCIIGSYLYGYTSYEAGANSAGPPIEELFGPLVSFNRRPASLEFPLGLGIPDWVFYAIVLPWFLCIVLTWIFCVFFMKDDDLGTDPPAVEREEISTDG